MGCSTDAAQDTATATAKEANLGFATRCIHHRAHFADPAHSVVEPLYLSTAFDHSGSKIEGGHISNGYDYARCQTPTREILEDTVCSLEGGDSCVAFSSGMAAIACLFELFAPGDRIVTSWDLYGGTIRLFDAVSRKNGYAIDAVDTSDLTATRAALADGAACLFVETPTNPTMAVSDIAALAEEAHKAGALLAVDNTFLTPYFQNPLKLGADVVVHSGTKYLNGHNDVLAGFLVSGRPDLSEKLRYLSMTTGATLSSFDAWMVTRGLKTLPLRMERHQSNALALAGWLRTAPHVAYVNYPGLADHPGHDLCLRQGTGFGGMITFGTDTPEAARHVLASVKVAVFAESLGGTETLITYPAVQTHADLSEEERQAKGIDACMLRISVGLEDPDDLIADFAQALEGC